MENLPKVIVEFLEKWAASANVYYKYEILELQEWKHNPENSAQYKRYIDYMEATNAKFSPLVRKVYEQHGPSSRNAGIEAAVKKEAERKAKDIARKLSDVVGTITGADYLNIGPNGELEGVIVGSEGKASIRTIYAGGYNIQRLHFRTLIREIAA